MVLSDIEIREYANKAEYPLIAPFCEDQLQGASYDLRMSNRVTVLKSRGQVIDASTEDDLSGIYEENLIDEQGYILAPGAFVLVEIAENIALPDNLIAHIRPRTRFTRCGVLVADQHCNPSYSGKLQVGLYNMGVNSILLKPGIRIAQMIFEELHSTPSEDKLYRNKTNAAYMDEQEFRGSVFGEASWSEASRQLYQDVIESLTKGDINGNA